MNVNKQDLRSELVPWYLLVEAAEKQETFADELKQEALVAQCVQKMINDTNTLEIQAILSNI